MKLCKSDNHYIPALPETVALTDREKKLIQREREKEEKQTSVANKKIPESS